MRLVDIFLSYIVYFDELTNDLASVKNVSVCMKYVDASTYKSLSTCEDLTEILNKCLSYKINNIKIELKGYYNSETISDFIFILCGLTDEVLIEYNSLFSEKWTNFLLEKEFFQTSISGEKILEMIHQHNEYHGDSEGEFGIIYHYVLSIGYKGQYKYNVQKYYALKEKNFNGIKDKYQIEDIDNVVHLSPKMHESRISNNYKNNIVDYKSIYLNIIAAFILVNVGYLLYLWLFFVKNKFVNYV